MPELKGLLEPAAMASCRVEMTARTEAGVGRLKDREKALCVFWGLKVFHLPFSHPGGLMGVLGTVVKIAALPMLDLRQDLPLGCSIALQFVGDDHARRSPCGVQQLAKEAQSCPATPLRLNQNVDVAPF